MGRSSGSVVGLTPCHPEEGVDCCGDAVFVEAVRDVVVVWCSVGVEFGIAADTEGEQTVRDMCQSPVDAVRGDAGRTGLHEDHIGVVSGVSRIWRYPGVTSAVTSP